MKKKESAITEATSFEEYRPGECAATTEKTEKHRLVHDKAVVVREHQQIEVLVGVRDDEHRKVQEEKQHGNEDDELGAAQTCEQGRETLIDSSSNYEKILWLQVASSSSRTATSSSATSMKPHLCDPLTRARRQLEVGEGRDEGAETIRALREHVLAVDGYSTIIPPLLLDGLPETPGVLLEQFEGVLNCSVSGESRFRQSLPNADIRTLEGEGVLIEFIQDVVSDITTGKLRVS